LVVRDASLRIIGVVFRDRRFAAVAIATQVSGDHREPGDEKPSNIVVSKACLQFNS